jgi:MFS family permease
MTETPPEKMYCYNHPQRETVLRCNRCDRPMCISCAVRTPTGYRCKECVRGQQKIFETARWWDFPLAAIIAGGLGWLGSQVTSFLGFFILFLAPVAGMLIAEAVRLVVRKRRSTWLPLVSAIAALVGTLASPLYLFVITLSYGISNGLAAFTGLLWPVLFGILCASTVFYRLKGIRL